MLLEQSDKELAAIGASIGANCRPCIEYHVRAGREAGLTDAQLTEALSAAEAVRDDAIALLSATAHALIGAGGLAPEPVSGGATSRPHELVALGASVGANSHPLLRVHITAALEAGLTAAQVEAALKMAEHVQGRAGQITADKATHLLEEAGVAEPDLQEVT